MATASIAALYPNSDAPSSAKKRAYTYTQWLDIVRHSYVRAAIKRATLNALTARGPWPGDDGPATATICVALDGMALGDKDGDGPCSRRTAQRRAKLACGLNYWRQLHGYNRWLPCPKCGADRAAAICPNAECKHRGRSRNRDGSTNTKEFCRPYTFEIDLEKFLTATPPKFVRHFCARTWKEHKEAAKHGEHPNVTEMPSRKPAQPDPAPPVPPPATAAPLKRPAAEHAHRSPEKLPQPKMTRRECSKFIADMAMQMKGCTHHTESVGGYSYELQPGDPRYRPKLSWREALAEVCERWQRAPESVIEALKFWGYQLQE
jgi:hypothetical protein